ncbi:hypothetical protein ACFWB2_37340 [Streptomyces virginiae]|uniref:hypothetical protein n=1 Tax=Streptomyces virginiae TaxID=1961 RepID=UPI002DDA952E|nr:hypothetical protein [Streptomyces virginiae]WSC82689.1 hypothetical protein OHA56_40135 [Streptomyces virginiae]
MAAAGAAKDVLAERKGAAGDKWATHPAGSPLPGPLRPPRPPPALLLLRRVQD